MKTDGAAKPERSEKPLILVIDDVAENLQLIGSILSEKNFGVILAGSGKKAFGFMKKKLPDLILLDIIMPEEDGYEVCKKLKSNSVTAEIPVIFLTAKIQIEDVVCGFEAGGIDYITKPFNKEELTARINTQLELKKTRQKLAELNATKDKLFSIISHDLRGMVGAVSNGLESTIKNIDVIGKDEMKKFLEEMIYTSDNTYFLLENLLFWAKSQLDYIQPSAEMNDIYDVVMTNLNLSDEFARKKNITIVSGIPKGTFAYFDKDMISIVMRNLLMNAIKYTGVNGKIFIKHKINKPFNKIEISVKDTGVGIPEEKLPAIFDFTKLKSTLGTGGEKGSGLGLTLCKEYVEKNYGEIECKSKPNQGTEFKFTLRLREDVAHS